MARPIAEENKILCPKCGKDADRNWNFCTNCGLQIKDQIVVVQYNLPEGSES